MRSVKGSVLLAGVLLAAASHADTQAQVVAQPATGDAAASAGAVPAATQSSATVVRSGARAEGGNLATVVVTARRKEERALDVPISLAVLDGDALADAGLSTATDLQERVPNLVVSVPNPRLTSFTIRGLGSSSSNDGLESSVGLFLDGVYLGRQGLSIFDLVDLDRVEVLRGPQGTLFGKNTTAGAVNIVTKLPSQDFEANLESTFGNLGNIQYRGSVTGALVDDVLAGRLTGYLTRRDGLITNTWDGVGTPGDDSVRELNNRNKYGLRGQLLWTPVDGFKARFIAELGKTDEDCCVYPLVGPVRDAVAARDRYMGYERASLSAYDRLATTDGETSVSVEQKALSAELTWDIGHRHRLTSLTAWRDWTFQPENDDATSLRLTATGTRNEHSQISQEFRLDSSFKIFDSVVGLYYLRQDFYGREDVRLQEDMARWVFGGLINQASPNLTYRNTGLLIDALFPPQTLAGMRVVTPYTQVTDSAAAFGSINWHLTPRLDLTTGVRYTHEWKEAEVSRSRSGGNVNASPLALTNLLSILPAPFNSFTLNGLLDSIAGGDFYRADTRDEGNVSGQVALTFKLDENLNVYASVARGYKGGGINLGVTGTSVQPTFEPEVATAYEIGAKGQFFNRRLTLSLAAYQTDVEDYQALTFDDENTLIPNPRQTNLLNVGAVRLRGVELDAFGYIGRGLFARLAAAYSQAVTTDFRNAPDEDTRENTKDLSGKRLYNAPTWSGSAGLEQRIPLGSLEAYAGIDYSFKTGYYATVEQGRASYIDGYGLTNARVGLRNGNNHWDVSLWARNLFDVDYVASVHPLYGVGDYGAFAGDPLTYGVTLRANLY